MSFQKRLATDFLFAFQIIGAFIKSPRGDKQPKVPTPRNKPIDPRLLSQTLHAARQRGGDPDD
ncbi:hypothetical protein L0Y69_00085 [bacterium]|nr:hypothetical protein [bacterium]